jgi:quinol monooxygenase YgiN
MPIRIFHQSCRSFDDDQELLDLSRQARGIRGCLESEFYRGIEFPQNALILQLWQDQYLFADYWDGLLGGGAGPLEVFWKSTAERRYAMDSSEFYEHCPFIRSSDGSEVFVAPGQGDRSVRIFWPSAGALRILTLHSPASVEKELDLIHWLDTGRRAEPGCLQCEHFCGMEFQNHVAICEVWESQKAFDSHQLSNRRTAKLSDVPSNRDDGVRQHGQNSREFYRFQQFVNLYQFWYPKAGESRSDVVTWPW